MQTNTKPQQGNKPQNINGIINEKTSAVQKRKGEESFPLAGNIIKTNQ